MANDSSSELPDSLESAPLGVPYYALDTLELIGRQAELAAIDEALDAHVGRSTTDTHVIVFRGPGGVGKTRLLREAVARARDRSMLTSAIIDLYHSDIHSNSGIEAAIIHGLCEVPDPHIWRHVQQAFRQYESERAAFETSRAQAVDFDLIEKARSALRTTFVRNFNDLAAQYPVLLVLDTAELIQFESDIIQRVCQIANVAVEVKAWLTETLPQLQNTVILIAGRGPRANLPADPRIQLWADFDQALAAANATLLQRFELAGFTDAEGVRYFDSVVSLLRATMESLSPGPERRHLEHAIVAVESVPDDVRMAICRSLEGRPIRLGLAIDLLIGGDDLDPLLTPDAAWSTELRASIVKRLYEVTSNTRLRLVLDYLTATRYGLDVALLQHLEPGWHFDECRQYLLQVQTLSFVKTRPGTQQVFLHDEMYDLLDEGIVRPQYDVRFRTIYDRIATYYEKLADKTAPTDGADDPETLQVKQVHYRLYDDPQRGYTVYATFDHAAIEGYEFGLDMKLRDEILRFYNESENAETAANRGLPRVAIDRDSVVRWIQRYLARDNARRAAEVAEIILGYGPEPYEPLVSRRENRTIQLEPTLVGETRRMLDNANALFWGRLLTFYGEALLYLSPPFNDNKNVLANAITVLDGISPGESPEFPLSLRPLLLGRAHNNLGYLYRSHGRYGQALEEYKYALRRFPRDDQDERANTLNNLAYLLGLLGRTNLAKANIDEAIEIRQRIGKQYPLALSRNTLGLIYTRDDHPMWGERECREALRIFEGLDAPRGIGLALLGLGYALRQRGDQWKRKIYTPGEASAYFADAAEQLRRAAVIFENKVEEPARLWESYNELGSLYGDEGWLAAESSISSGTEAHEVALRFYAESIAQQLAAFRIAQAHDMEFQLIDSCIDLAQVYGDRSFLFERRAQPEEAARSRTEAEKYLSEVQKSLVPDQFKLVPGVGFAPSSEPGVTYWLHLGKTHMWRGVWAFRDVENAAIPSEKQLDHLASATRELITAAVYFQHYWPKAPDRDRTLTYLGKFLKTAQVSPEWAQDQVQLFARAYPQVELKDVVEAIGDLIGL